MCWNNGKERKIFENRQRVLAEQYRSVGMTEEQIKKMYEFDLEVFKGERVYQTHTQALEMCFDEEDDEVYDVSCFFVEYQQATNFRDCSNRHWWVDELDNLCQAAKSLSEEEIELVSLYVFEGYTQKEIANKFNCSQVAVWKRLNKIKRVFLHMQGGDINGF